MALRFELSGTMAPPTEPPVPSPSNPPRGILIYTPTTIDSVLHVKELMDSGYTAFDVICIGAGGGQGGYVDPWIPYADSNGILINPPTGSPSKFDIKATGGAGGGGGIHRVQGDLADLPDEVAVLVGVGGIAGTNHATDHTATTDGGDGGASTFNDTTCQASGGKGGQKAQGDRASAANPGSSDPSTGTNPNGVPGANGGDGGVGGSSVAGGGGHGGVGDTIGPVSWATYDVNLATETAATPGAWNPATGIGGGGGGGAGGVAYYDGSWYEMLAAATDGAGGAFDADDNSSYAPGSTASVDPFTVGTPFAPAKIIPGWAGGATASLITALATIYGDSQTDPGTRSIGGTTVTKFVDSLPGKDGVVIVAVSAK